MRLLAAVKGVHFPTGPTHTSGGLENEDRTTALVLPSLATEMLNISVATPPIEALLALPEHFGPSAADINLEDGRPRRRRTR